MKTYTFYVVCSILVLASCQKSDPIEVQEDNQEGKCTDIFEQLNDRIETAPILIMTENSEWLSLLKNDNDYWRIVVKSSTKNKVPTQITYDISEPSNIVVAVMRKDTLVSSPKTTMTFRNNIREVIDIPDMKIGDTLTVQMRYISGTPTCYSLGFQ
ncbi:MAG: hypothetical protein JNL70_06780 [Saprospiraceae bacterium]|nr:hypothetical protein [Saprospiraceae bacterium]